MINEDDFKTADRVGHILGVILTIGSYALVLWPLLRATMQ